MKIKEISIEALIPYEKNPRKNKAAVPYVARSIEKFGFKVPIVVDKNNVIVAGHTRYLAAKKLDMLTVPCIVADDLNEKQIKAFRLADNKVAEKAEWDFELLNEELAELDGYEMFELGFEDLLQQENEPQEDDYEPDVEAIEEPKAKLGEIYKLGRHRLMCGDSTKYQDVEKLMDGEQADLIVTDPPYNVNYEKKVEMQESKNKTRARSTIENDSMESSQFHAFLFDCFQNAQEVLKPGGSFYVWYASKEHINFESALAEAGLPTHQQLIWNKNTLNLSMSDYQWKHEPCLYGWKEGKAHYFTEDRTNTTVMEIDPKDIDKMKKDELVDLLKKIYSMPTTIINEDKPLKSDLHPTMKPIRLIARQVQNSSRPGEKVLDLFGGSGSTLMACEQLDRDCYIMEFDPKYVDVIIDRWETFTGEKAVKL